LYGRQVSLIVLLVVTRCLLWYSMPALVQSMRCVMNDFGCAACSSAALLYPKILEDDQPVACAGCGAFVLTYGELKRRAERAASSNPRRFPVSGC
jgi:hypothetical protein